MVYRYYCIEMVALGLVGLVVLAGLHLPQAVAQDINTLREAADQGDAEAQWTLGVS